MVYHAIQQVDANDPNGTECSDPNQTTKALEEQISTLKSREKGLREMLAKVNAVIPLSVLKDQISSLEEKKALLGSQVSTLSAEMQESSNCVCKEDFDRIDLEWRKWHAQVTSRKRIFLEFWARCTEVLPEDMTPGDLKVILFLWWCQHYDTDLGDRRHSVLRVLSDRADVSRGTSSQSTKRLDRGSCRNPCSMSSPWCRVSRSGSHDIGSCQMIFSGHMCLSLVKMKKCFKSVISYHSSGSLIRKSLKMERSDKSDQHKCSSLQPSISNRYNRYTSK